MCLDRNCPCYTGERAKENRPAPKNINFISNGKILSAMANVHDTSFYVITDGTHRGNLVHIFDIIK